MTKKEQQLWTAYRQSRSTADRNAIVEIHLDMARAVAGKCHERLGHHVDIATLISDANLGLILAVEMFSADFGTNFAMFAAQRIKFFILDQVRERDTITRSHRERSTRIREAVDRIRMRTGRAALIDELIAELGISKREYERWENTGYTTTSAVFNYQADPDDSDANRAAKVASYDDLTASIADPSDIAALRNDFEGLLKECEPEERLCVLLRYILGWDTLEIQKRMRARGFCSSNVQKRINSGLVKARRAAEEGGLLCR